MTSIAELGIRVDSVEAAQAASDLDKLTLAGSKAEKSTASLANQSDKAESALQDLGRQAQAAEKATAGFSNQTQKAGVSAAQTAAALRGVPAQFTDIVTSLQGGQAPLTVLLQQGGQLKDMFGGIGPAARALGGYVGGLINPFTAAAAVVTTMTAAVVAGMSELNAFNKALVATGGSAGYTGDELADLQGKLAGGKYFSQANEALLSLAQSGKLSGETFSTVAAAATQLSAATGQGAGDIADQFVKAKENVSAFALEFNSRYHAISLSTFDQISALEDQGRHMDALKLLAGEVSEEMTRRNKEIEESTRGISKLWDDATNSVRGYWNELKRGVAADPDEFNKQVLQGQVEDLDKQFWFSEEGKAKLRKQYTDEIDLIQKRIDARHAETKSRAEDEAAIQRQAVLTKDLSDQLDNVSPMSKRNKALEELKQKFIDLTAAAKETGKASPLLAGVSYDGENFSGGAYDKLAKGIESRFKDKKTGSSSVGLTGFNDQKNALAELVSTYQNSYKELDAAQRAGVISQEAYTAQRSTLIRAERDEVTAGYEAEIAALEEAKGRASTSAAQRIQLDQKIADARTSMVKAQKDADSQLEVLATNEQGRLAKQAQAVKTYTDALHNQVETLRQQGRQAAATLGMGDRQSSLYQAQNAIDDRVNQQKLDLANQYGDGSRGMSLDEYNQKLAALNKTQQDLHDTVLANYNDMTAAQGDWSAGASAAWQNYLDNGQNVAGQMKTAFTDLYDGLTDSLVDFAFGADESFGDVAVSFAKMLAKMAVQAAASSVFSSIFGSVATAGIGGLGGLGTTAAAGASGFDFGLGSAASGLAYSGGFSGGGYTGDGGKFEPAGVVHGGEFVLRKEVVSQPGMRDYLEGLNAKGYADGGYVSGMPARLSGASAGGVNVTVYAPVTVSGQDQGGGQIDQQQLQRSFQQQMQTVAERAVAESWRAGGISFKQLRSG